MTVRIGQDAKNLREELASLRNQGGYQEQQFYFDGLVTNGTFDTATTGWTASSATLSVVSGKMRITNTGAGFGLAYQSFSTVVGKVYTATLDFTAGTANGKFGIGTTATGEQLGSTAMDATSPKSITFVATSAITWLDVVIQNAGIGTFADFDNISVFETDGTDVIHTMPKGWKPKDVFEDGLLQREGAAHDYTIVYDGFDYYVKPAVAPSATTQTCVIGVKA